MSYALALLLAVGASAALTPPPAEEPKAAEAEAVPAKKPSRRRAKPAVKEDPAAAPLPESAPQEFPGA